MRTFQGIMGLNLEELVTEKRPVVKSQTE